MVLSTLTGQEELRKPSQADAAPSAAMTSVMRHGKVGVKFRHIP